MGINKDLPSVVWLMISYIKLHFLSILLLTLNEVGIKILYIVYSFFVCKVNQILHCHVSNYEESRYQTNNFFQHVAVYAVAVSCIYLFMVVVYV